MRRTNKKGFTIVELVIVIAVVAILAAVLIPTFASLVDKANQSADIQAVRQMNTILATYTDGSIKTVTDAVAALDKENIDLEDYKPLVKDHYFYFVLDKNNNPMVIYADKADKIVYPENPNVEATAQRMSLSGLVHLDSNYTIADNGSVSIDSGAKLAHLMKQVSDNKVTVKTIVLTQDVDLKGAATNFGKITVDVTIKAATGTVKLSGIRTDDHVLRVETGEFAGDTYGYGLFGEIPEGKTVTIENVVISNMVVGDEHAKTVGLIAGYMNGTLNLKNVKIENCSVTGYQKVGAVAGRVEKGSLTMDNVQFENVTVSGSIDTAKIVGNIERNLNVTGNKDFSGITVKALVDKPLSRSDFSLNITDITLKGSEDNVFVYAGTAIYNATTNDWAWYNIGKEYTNLQEKDSRNNGAKYNGTNCFLNGSVSSASTNFVNGVPQDTTTNP